MKWPSPWPACVELAGQRRRAAAAEAVAHHHQLLDLELGDGELQRRRDAVIIVVRLERRDEIGDVADDEHLARPRVENLGRIDPAVRAGDDHHPGALADRQLLPALALLLPMIDPEAAIAFDQIAELRHGAAVTGSGEGVASRGARRYLAGMSEADPAMPPEAAQARLDPGQGADQRRLRRDQGADAPAEPRHGLRGGGLPQYRRVLDQEARDGDDPGRHLHPGLRLLQREDGDAARGRSAGARACRGRRGRAGAGAYRRHLGRSRRSAGRRRVASSSR